jgi:hypothetical protein
MMAVVLTVSTLKVVLVDWGFGVPVNCRNVILELFLSSVFCLSWCSCKRNWCDHLYSWSSGTFFFLRGAFPDSLPTAPHPCSASYLSSCCCSHPHPWSAQCHLLVSIIWTFDFCGCNICFQSLEPLVLETQQIGLFFKKIFNIYNQ